MGCTRRDRLPHCNENPIYVFPEKELRGLSPNFHIYVSVSDIYIYIYIYISHIFLQQNKQTHCGRIYKSLTGCRQRNSFSGKFVSKFQYCVFAKGVTKVLGPPRRPPEGCMAACRPPPLGGWDTNGPLIYTECPSILYRQNDGGNSIGRIPILPRSGRRNVKSAFSGPTVLLYVYARTVTPRPPFVTQLFSFQNRQDDFRPGISSFSLVLHCVSQLFPWVHLGGSTIG